MERMERALQKAREQRREAAAQLGAQAGTAAAAVPPSAAEGIVYRETRTVPTDKAVLRENRVVAWQTQSIEADIFRILRTKVLQKLAEGGHRTLAVTSCNPGEGKTLVASNLAVSLAMDVKQTVLLADLDLRRPGVHSYFGITPETGLSDYLTNGAALTDCLIRPQFERLVLLPVCKTVDNSSEMLATPKMAALAQELRSRYPDRIVIYDMPPLLTTDDTLAFLPHVDAVLLVVEERRTLVEDIKRATAMLQGRNLIGTVVNKSAEGGLSQTYERR